MSRTVNFLQIIDFLSPIFFFISYSILHPSCNYPELTICFKENGGGKLCMPKRRSASMNFSQRRVAIKLLMVTGLLLPAELSALIHVFKRLKGTYMSFRNNERI